MSVFTGILNRLKNPFSKETERIDKVVRAHERQEGNLTAQSEFDFRPTRLSIESQINYLPRGYYNQARTAWEMYSEDDRIRANLDALAEDATEINREGRPFNIEVSKIGSSIEKEQDEEKLENLFRDKYQSLGLFNNATNIIKWSLLEGSRFYRIVVDFNTKEIIELRHIKGPKKGFITVEIDEGQFKGCYIQFEYLTQQPVAIFAPWEVVRFDWNKPDEDNFGLSFLSSASVNWDRLFKTEKDLFTARKKRAYPRLNKQYPNATIEELKSIMAAELEEAKKYGDETIEAILYTTGDAKILEASNSALFNIDDVRYAQSKLFASLRRPAALTAGYGSDTANRSILERQEHRYVKGLLPAICNMFANGMKKLNTVQLILWGYLPQDWEVNLIWPKKSVEDKRILGLIAKDGVDRMALPLSVYAELFDRDEKTIKKEIEEDLAWRAEIEERFSPSLVDVGFQPPKDENG